MPILEEYPNLKIIIFVKIVTFRNNNYCAATCLIVCYICCLFYVFIFFNLENIGGNQSLFVGYHHDCYSCAHCL